MSNFAVNPIINITRSRFKQKHRVLTSFNAGVVVPIDCTEILPGDTYKRTIRKLVRMTTPIKPTMDDLYLDVMSFFVPRRKLWDHWEEFQGANNSGPWKQTTTYTIPQTTAPASTGWTEGSLADYLGIPTKVPGLSVDSCYFRAYCKIWNDWFRDENLQDFTYFSTGDSTTTGTNGTNYVSSPETGGCLLPAAKMHDYFTSCLPEQQKGPDVLLPLGEVAPIYARDKNAYTSFRFVGSTGDPWFKLQSTTWSTPTGGDGTGETHTTPRLTGDLQEGQSTINYKDIRLPLRSELSAPNKSALIADLRDATAAKIATVRQAFQLQKMFEKDARGGTRYIEILKNHFGVTSSDARLQRSEYLGGKQIPIMISQVNQTSSTDSTSPQGNTAAYSLTCDIEESFTKSFEEHGILMTVAIVRCKHTYQQGLDRKFSRVYREDFYMPVFSSLSEQPVYNRQIFAQGNSTDAEVFGFQEAWAEYRYTPNIVTGEMRSNATHSQDIWHYADYYASLPTLGADFIKESVTNIDRTLAVQSSSAHQFIGDFQFDDVATRCMPLYSIPGLVDHH